MTYSLGLSSVWGTDYVIDTVEFLFDTEGTTEVCFEGFTRQRQQHKHFFTRLEGTNFRLLVSSGFHGLLRHLQMLLGHKASSGQSVFEGRHIVEKISFLLLSQKPLIYQLQWASNLMAIHQFKWPKNL